MDLNEEIECNICGTELNDKFTHKLKCNHVFHYECLMKTFQSMMNNKSHKKNYCPYCRSNCNYLPIINGLKRIVPGIHCHNDNQCTIKKILKDEFSNTCKFILTRGKNKGQPCSKNCLLGYEYCTNHKKAMKL